MLQVTNDTACFLNTKDYMKKKKSLVHAKSTWSTNIRLLYRYNYKHFKLLMTHRFKLKYIVNKQKELIEPKHPFRPKTRLCKYSRNMTINRVTCFN